MHIHVLHAFVRPEPANKRTGGRDVSDSFVSRREKVKKTNELPKRCRVIVSEYRARRAGHGHPFSIQAFAKRTPFLDSSDKKMLCSLFLRRRGGGKG